LYLLQRKQVNIKKQNIYIYILFFLTASSRIDWRRASMLLSNRACRSFSLVVYTGKAIVEVVGQTNREEEYNERSVCWHQRKKQNKKGVRQKRHVKTYTKQSTGRVGRRREFEGCVWVESLHGKKKYGGGSAFSPCPFAN
jgi:hypothetical protein